MPLRTDLLHPIDGSNPAGEDLRYEPIYDEIKQARFEEEDLPQGDWDRERKVADHPAVIRLAEEALAKETKDLQLAAWLTEALLHERGFGGLREGLELLRGLLETFWEHLYPEIEDDDLDFRAMPLSWVGGYLEVAVKSVPLNSAGHSLIDYNEAQKVGREEEATTTEAQTARQEAIAEGALTPEDFDASFAKTPKPFYKQLIGDIDTALEAIRELDELGSEKFGHDAPSYRQLREAAEEVRRIGARLLKEKLEQDPDPAGEESYDLDDPSGGAEGGGMSPDPTSRVDAARRIASVARYLRHDRPTDPAPYLLLRGFRWGELLSDQGEPDPRLLDAPATPVRTRLRGLLLDAKWDELLDACEDVMATPQGRGWLDLQRYTLTACDELGSEYEVVGSAIRGALGRLLRDVSSLPQLVLMDDTPTANRETLTWLAEAGLAEAGDDAAPAAPAPSRSTTQTLSAVVSRAAAMARRGDTEDAVGLLMSEISRATSERSRFLLQSEAARIMVDSRMDPVARPLLEEMNAAIEKHQLEEWEEGTIVAQALAQLYVCVQRAEGEHAGQELYQAVCRLDPMLGMRVASQLKDDAAASQEPDEPADG